MIINSPNLLGYIPASIVSLVPSQTELLHYLGLESSTKGITKFCVHPDEWFRNKIRVGGTKNIDIQKIEYLQPDLIIANKEENVQEQVEALAEKFPVWVTDVNNLEEALGMILDIGILTHREQEAATLVNEISIRFASIEPMVEKIPTAYFIWKNPYMTVGSDTFIHSMMELAGFENVFANEQRYPTVNTKDLLKKGCQLLLLSSEPYPFKQKDIDELQEQLPGVQICLADGELFSWYGSRLLQSPDYFAKLRQVLKD